VQLHPNARAHIDGDTIIRREWLLDPEFGALHAKTAYEVLATLLIFWHDPEPRASHVARKCEPHEGLSAWGKQFLDGCEILEEEYTEEQLLRKIKEAAVSAVRTLGFVCNLDPASEEGW
jgi:hypothetical protein